NDVSIINETIMINTFHIHSFLFEEIINIKCECQTIVKLSSTIKDKRNRMKSIRYSKEYVKVHSNTTNTKPSILIILKKLI
ncbi:hypothetical protein KM1_249780, partial [Entamoeba histolytica HM-3:IMSS]